MKPILLLALTIFGCLSSAPLACAQKAPAAKAASDGFMDIGGNLTIDPPVNLYDPNAEHVVKVRVGDVVQLQVRYPIVPPMPKSVKISDDKKSIDLVATTLTASEVAILKREPQTNGKIGIGYIQVWVRPTRPGKHRAELKIQLQDGTTKNIFYMFEVQGDQ